MRILGLDASTTTIGWCLLEFDENWNLLGKTIGFYKPPKDGHIVHRLFLARQEIYRLLNELKPDRVILEDILLQHPKTTIKTLALLAVFNRMVCLAIYDKLGILPNLFAPMKIRHAIKLEKKIPKKEEVPAIMEHHLGKIDWPITDKGKNKGQRKKECNDIADSAACAYAFKVTSQREALKSVKKMKNAKTKVS